MQKRRGRPPHDDLLTPAEWRTVHAVRHGLTNRQIAERRGISLDAVKFHVANAVAKLGLGSRAALRHWRGVPKDSPVSAEEARMSNAPDIRAACRALEARGVEFINAPHMIHRHEDGTEEWMAFFNDAEGRPLAIMATAAPGGTADEG